VTIYADKFKGNEMDNHVKRMGERRKFLLENMKRKHHLQSAVGIKFNITYLSLPKERAGDKIQGLEIIKLTLAGGSAYHLLSQWFLVLLILRP
jgi:hypothetical protein